MDTDRTPSAGGLGVFGYCALFAALYGLVQPFGMLADIATSYMLKDRLHASASEVSLFRLLTVAPMYVAFAFGLTRDIWSPLGRRDRGYFLLFGPVIALVFAALAFMPLNYMTLLVAMVMAAVCCTFVFAAFTGLLALLGQERMMSGQLTTVWRIVNLSVAVAGAVGGGLLAQHVPPRVTFLLLAALGLGIGAFGLWRPRAVYDGVYSKPAAKGAGLIDDIRRLVRHKAVYAPVLMMLLFQFAPGANTPLQYYLTNVVHASDAVYGEFQAIFEASFAPVFLLYGWLCSRVALEKLLWWGCLITVPQMIPLAFVHSATAALVLAVPMGVMGALCVMTIWDLTMRSCPPGLQGTLMSLVMSVDVLAQRAGDVLGSWIYNTSPTNGFVYCVIAITAVYALIPPLILLVPKSVIRRTDGQAEADPEAPAAAAQPVPA